MGSFFGEALGDIAGGRALDVATGEGGFVELLAECLESYTEITGVDASERAIDAARSALAHRGFRFVHMDAEELDFADQSFDTVSISASLHHLANVPPVLAEMRRVLRPGGRFVVVELHRDGHTEAQLTFVYLHHWVAQVDSALGILHHSTLARREILDHVDALRLCSATVHEFSDTSPDPMDEATIAKLEALIDKGFLRAKGTTAYPAIRRRGEELRRRLHEVGAQREPALLVVARKPG